jgi:hypothetical protein
MIDEVDEPVALGQIVHEAVSAARVALGGEILQEGDLHRGAGKEHPGVPPELFLDLHELGPYRPSRAGRVVLLDRDGETEVGRSEPDSYQVEGLVAPAVGLRDPRRHRLLGHDQ